MMTLYCYINFISTQSLILGCENPFLKNEWIVDLLKCIQSLSDFRGVEPDSPEMSLFGFCDSPEPTDASTHSSSDNLSNPDVASPSIVNNMNYNISSFYEDLVRDIHT